MINEDWMEESIDQFLRFIENSKEILGCISGSQSIGVKEIPNYVKIKDTCAFPHDHLHTYFDEDSSEIMISNYNETQCRFSRISIVVMLGSHSSPLHLNLDTLKDDHVTLSSSIYHTICHKVD